MSNSKLIRSLRRGLFAGSAVTLVAGNLIWDWGVDWPGVLQSAEGFWRVASSIGSHNGAVVISTVLVWLSTVAAATIVAFAADRTISARLDDEKRTRRVLEEVRARANEEVD